MRRGDAAGLLAAIGAWPIIACAIQKLVNDPASHSAWCGAPPDAPYELLGHCPACWAGAALMLGAIAWMRAGARLVSRPIVR